ncbi:hypothetical protein HMPREF9065_00558 [Aggregatibacter sp. oral taxon 458 str. W10330]|nr:hypothetical protein HMPREF9065_00558 [Aggregatibacter sp. oral taxon 458 str. W10330]
MFFSYVITECARIINLDLRLKSIFIPKIFGEVLNKTIFDMRDRIMKQKDH